MTMVVSAEDAEPRLWNNMSAKARAKVLLPAPDGPQMPQTFTWRRGTGVCTGFPVIPDFTYVIALQRAIETYMTMQIDNFDIRLRQA